MSDAPAIDHTAFDFDNPLHGIEAVRAAIPHRFEFEMLSGVVHVDPVAKIIVGFKDLKADEFWTRGHLPGFPILPGVLMCEAAAQLTAFYYMTQGVGPLGVLMGLGAMDAARFVRMVRPGERLVLVGTGLKVHRRLTRFRVQGFVGKDPAFEATVTGVPLGDLEELRRA
jgi:3-hydroxyacyl-[acyl-carrier-protein] dehydratase